MISIHAPRGGSDITPHIVNLVSDDISIHAPRGGSDRAEPDYLETLENFNPRSPWGERPSMASGDGAYCLFQSTLPVGGATATAGAAISTNEDFNPRSPWGERRRIFNTGTPWHKISIHAPRGGSDPLVMAPLKNFTKISIHAPRGGSDWISTVPCGKCRISIHAPRGGSDDKCPGNGNSANDFNPRSPWGERLTMPAKS